MAPYIIQTNLAGETLTPNGFPFYDLRFIKKTLPIPSPIHIYFNKLLLPILDDAKHILANV